MSDLKQQISTDLTTAMKARDEVRVSTLRMALTAVTALRSAGLTLHAIVASEGACETGRLALTLDGLRPHLPHTPLHALPRAGHWKDAPSMLEWLA